MRIIKLKSAGKQGGDIYINIEQIGNFYDVPTKYEYGRVEEEAYTIVGVTTHNNGGFKVKETAKQILGLIEKSKGI